MWLSKAAGTPWQIGKSPLEYVWIWQASLGWWEVRGSRLPPTLPHPTPGILLIKQAGLVTEGKGIWKCGPAQREG